MPDDLLDVGGYRLYLRRRGEGGPAVVLDAGTGDCASTGAWESVEPHVAAFTTVCSYDRAGLGRSGAGPAPRTSGRMVEELRALLAAAGVRPPYVLVGHSFGGFNVRLFAARYPAEVAGLLLVDPAHEEGRRRLLVMLSPKDQAEHIRRGNSEGSDWEASVAELGAAGPLPPIPVTVLSRGQMALIPDGWPHERAERWEGVWAELQLDLAQRIPGSKQIIAQQSRHYIQRFEPELVVAIIRELVDDARRRPAGNLDPT